MIETILRELRQSEWVHVLLNPLPIYGLAIGLLALVIALIARSRPARTMSLILIFVCAISAWPVFETGENAYDPVLSMSDDTGQAWLKAHKERAEKLIPVFYALAFFALAALFAGNRWSKLSLASALLVLLIGLTTLSVGAYIGYAGGRIRHKEFRNGPPPVTSPTP